MLDRTKTVKVMGMVRMGIRMDRMAISLEMVRSLDKTETNKEINLALVKDLILGNKEINKVKVAHRTDKMVISKVTNLVKVVHKETNREAKVISLDRAADHKVSKDKVISSKAKVRDNHKVKDSNSLANKVLRVHSLVSQDRIKVRIKMDKDRAKVKDNRWMNIH